MHFFIGQRLERFVCRVDSCFLKVQPKCWFKICYPLPAVDVFLRHLRTHLFDRLIIFFRIFSDFWNVFPRLFPGSIEIWGTHGSQSQAALYYIYVIITKWFMIWRAPLSYGCTLEIGRQRKKGKSCSRLSPRATLDFWVLSQPLPCIHNLMEHAKSWTISFIT